MFLYVYVCLWWRMKGRCLPLSPEKSLHQWKVDKDEMPLLLVLCVLLYSPQPVNRGGCVVIVCLML